MLYFVLRLIIDPLYGSPMKKGDPSVTNALHSTIFVERKIHEFSDLLGARNPNSDT